MLKNQTVKESMPCIRLSWIPGYHSWRGMRERCLNPNSISYRNYGAKGIDCDPRWQDFRLFFWDLGPRPQGYTLERIDNERGYWPDNCCWADRAAQSRNTSRNLNVQIDGQAYCAKDAADKLGIHYAIFKLRLNEGWPLDEIVKRYT